MFKIYSWNVNGIRAIINKNLLASFIASEGPDVLCLQEIKARPDQVSLTLPQYHQFWNPAQKPGYSGTAIFSKQQPLKTVTGLPADLIQTYKIEGDAYGSPDSEGRVIAAEFQDYWVLSVYTPNAKDDLSRLQLRFKQWDPAFLAYCQRLENNKPVIICGDLNVAHTEIDLANPGPNRGKKGFTDEERSGFQAFIDHGFIDSFRLFTSGKGYYTWWSHFANARARNVGWRIDYILVSQKLKPKVQSADIHPQIMGSDHCPVSIALKS